MKHHRVLKRFFNLVEVSLAIAVSSIGVVGVLGVLPFAMKTTRATTRDSY